ncbi:hypothetical protein ACS0TY_014760 [Phlomoides rotata]
MVKDPENVWHASMGGRFRREDEIPLYSWHNLWQGKWKRHSDHSYDIGEDESVMEALAWHVSCNSLLYEESSSQTS